MADNPKPGPKPGPKSKPTEAQHLQTEGELAVSAAASAVSEIAGRVTDTGRQSLERARDDATRIASRSLDIGSQAVDAYVEAGKRASARLNEVNKALTESYSRSLADYSDLAQRTVSCRTVEDLVSLQNEALQRMKGNFDAMTQVYGLFVDAFAESLQPIADSAATARERFRGAA